LLVLTVLAHSFATAGLAGARSSCSRCLPIRSQLRGSLALAPRAHGVCPFVRNCGARWRPLPVLTGFAHSFATAGLAGARSSCSRCLPIRSQLRGSLALAPRAHGVCPFVRNCGARWRSLLVLTVFAHSFATAGLAGARSSCSRCLPIRSQLRGSLALAPRAHGVCPFVRNCGARWRSLLVLTVFAHSFA